MLKSTQDLERLSQTYITEFNDFCTSNDLVGKVQADHICIKCSTAEIFELQRKLFEFDSNFVYQSIISKRRIAIIGLSTSIPTVVGDIKYLELSDQKLDGSQNDRIDHVEIVPVTISYDELVAHIKDKGVSMEEVVRPHHTTHDVHLKSGFIIRLSQGLLINKIKREEMV